MEFGVHFPHIGPQANRENLIRFAREADSLGFESGWVSDHIAWPTDIASRYPYNQSGDFPAGSEVPWLDAIGTLLFLAGCTERIQLGTSVMILGYRPPVQTAKLWATLDVVSGGRAILGVGVGWMREEFEVLGMPFDNRGTRADEMLFLFDSLFNDELPIFSGHYYRFAEIGFNPKPVNGQIPIWVGGHSPPAYRRAARFGNAFHAVFIPPATVAEQWAAVSTACEEWKRDPSTLDLTVRLRLALDSEAEDSGALGGRVEQIVDGIGRYAEAGVCHITMDVVASGGVEGQIEAIQRFAADVRPKVG